MSRHTGGHPTHRTYRAMTTSFRRISPAAGNPCLSLEAR
ncbi:hypothetical protein [Streptomyces flaveolus]